MKRVLSQLLTIVFIINIVLTGLGNLNFVYAEDNTFNFEWEKTKKLSDVLELTDRSTSYDDVFLWWDFGINETLNVDNGKYSLSYNISDGKRVDFTVEKKSSVATITYRVWDYAKNAYVNTSDTTYEVYKNTSGTYVEPVKNKLPAIGENVTVIYDDTGKPIETKGASFKIIQNTGFSFKFDNKTIRFKWVKGSSNDIFYFSTDGVSQGNIYDVDLKLDIIGGSTVQKKLEIFTGINPNTFSSIPYANNRKTIIDHSTRPFTDDDPGTGPEIDIQFDMPKVWNSTTNKYEYPNSTYMNNNPTSVILDLGHTDDKKKIQVIIDNIYSNDINGGTTYSTYSQATVTASKDTTNNSVKVNVANLEAGTIYNPVEISLSKSNEPTFLADSTHISHGKVYTYPVYTVISSSADEFYLKIEP